MRYPRPRFEFTWFLVQVLVAAIVLFVVWLLIVLAWAIVPAVS